MRSWCDIKEKELDIETIKAVKTCIKGLITKEIITEYAIDEETGKLKVVKQKVSEKYLPPNVDLIKMVYPQIANNKTDYNKLSDEELEQVKQRLLKELKESNNVGGENKNKN